MYELFKKEGVCVLYKGGEGLEGLLFKNAYCIEK